MKEHVYPKELVSDCHMVNKCTHGSTSEVFLKNVKQLRIYSQRNFDLYPLVANFCIPIKCWLSDDQQSASINFEILYHFWLYKKIENRAGAF